MKIASTHELQELDRIVQADYGVPGLVSMENAALRVVEFLEQRYFPLNKKSISIVCGRGNNGGDGLAIARQLHARSESSIIVWLVSDPGFFQGEAAASYRMAKSFGVDLRSAAKMDLSSSDIIVDAIFGSGLQGAVLGECARLIDLMNSSRKAIIAVDIPSGLSADGLESQGSVVKAKTTISFILPKFGMLNFPGAAFAGEIVNANICFPKKLLADFTARCFAMEASDIGQLIPRRVENKDSNKASFGGCVLLAGSRKYSGAAILMAEAAIKSGAGLVRLVVPEPIFFPTMARISPAVILCSLASETMQAILEKSSAVGMGPGIENDQETESSLTSMIQSYESPLLLDAGALEYLAKLDDQGQALLRSRKAATILTPHPGEMARLLKLETKQVQADRRAAVLAAAKKYSCIVVLKGARSLMASSEGILYVNTTGNPGMATAGAGDVLSGVITALLAQKLEPLQATIAGVYLHGLAGDLAAEKGMTGCTACDVLQHLPAAIAYCQSCARNSK